jgi:hypothetical protein
LTLLFAMMFKQLPVDGADASPTSAIEASSDVAVAKLDGGV